MKYWSVLASGILFGVFSVSSDAFSSSLPASSSPTLGSPARVVGTYKPFGSLRGYAGAHSVLLKDLATGRTLYAYEAERRLSPASLTKIMSALVILEYGHLEDHVLVTPHAAAARRIRLGV